MVIRCVENNLMCITCSIPQYLTPPITPPPQTSTEMTFEYREQIIPIAIAIMLFSIPARTQINVALQINNPPCGGFATGSILAIPVGGTSPYTYEWSTGSTDNPLTLIPAGTYTVTVTDDTGTTGTASGTLTEPDPLVVQIVVTDCGLPGAMEAVVSGGITPYQYEWSTGDTTTTISNLAADPYCLTITDLNSCGFQLCESIGNPMTVGANTSPAICGTGMGGGAAADIAGGVAPFDFLWSNGETTDSISNLPPGNYSVTVTAENGCTETSTEEVELVPGDYPITFDITQPDCSGVNSGSLTAIPGSGGVAPFLYKWSTGDSGMTIVNLPAGLYTVIVTDYLGCPSIDSTVLDSTAVIQIEFDSINPSCHGWMDGAITATATSGLAPFQYVWSTGDSTQSVDTLGAGTYIVTVTDSLLCSAIDSLTLTEPDTFVVNATSVNASFCGASDGTATAVPSGGGDPPFKYLWSTGDTLSTAVSLSAGTYFVTVTSSQGCLAKDSVAVGQAMTLAVVVEGTNIVCFNESNGELTAETSQGSPPYHYVWSNSDSTQTISNLAAGDYSVTVTSSEGCSGTASASIENNLPILINGTVTHVTCNGFSNGSISVTASGGTPPFNILWPNGSNSTILNNLQAGGYAVTITDAVGCSKVKSFTVNQPTGLNITFNSSAGSCGDNGFSNAIVTGGTGAYQYLWSTGETTSFIGGIAPGIYTVTVTDGNDCTKVSSVTINPYPSFALDVTATNTACNAISNGTASVVTFGGTAPFSYLWSNGATTSMIGSLSPGYYEVTVTDGNGCTESGGATVEMGIGLFAFIDADTIICPGESGTATAFAFGGTGPFYTYLWSNGQTGQTITDLAPGSYQVTVTDPTGCSGEAGAVISAGGNFTVNSSFQNVKCFGLETGSINLNVTDGIPPYDYSWNNGSNSSILQNIPAGNYSVTVSDLSGCTEAVDFEITEPPQLIVNVEGMDGICGNLGSADSEVNGGTMPYFYQWSNGSTDPSISILGTGTYTLTVTDANNCKAESSAIVEVISSVSCGIQLVQPVTSPNGSNGQLMATVSDGLAPFTFLWSNGGTTQSATNLPAGNYAVTITDANGCTAICSFFLMDGAQVGDFVWEDTNENGIQDPGETGMQGVEISLEGTDDYGASHSLNTVSGTQGNYYFDIPPGEYQITFNIPPGYVPSPQGQGADASLDSDADPLTNKTPMVPISPGDQNHGIDAGFFLEINCTNLSDPGEICCGQTLCGLGNMPDQIANLVPPSGGSGTLEYLWMYSETAGPFDPMTWTPITGSNSTEYQPGNLDTTTYFIRRSRREGCSQFLESNQIEILVNEIPTPAISTVDTVCMGKLVDVSGTDLGPSAVYSWFFENGMPETANTPDVEGIVWDTVGDYTISYYVEIDGCGATDSALINITENPVFCGYDLVLNGEMIDTGVVLLDWLYPESDTVDRSYSVEWAWENGPFAQIGTSDSTEVAGIFIHYFQTHTGPLTGQNFYRIILDDSEGTQLISNVVQIDRDSIPVEPEKEYRLVHAYPNPFSDVITVDVYDRFDVPITLELFNTLGQLVYFAEIPTDMDTIEIGTEEMASGTYFLFVRYDGKPQKIFKFVKGR